jgi:putative hemolysin
MEMYFFVMFVCLVLNGLIACVEMAFVSASPHELKKLAGQGNTRAARILKLRTNPERTLSVLQIGLTLVSAVSAAVGGMGAEEKLAPLFESGFGVSEVTSEYLALACIVIPITFLTVVFGELVPKAFALREAVRIDLWAVRVLEVADRVLAPAITCMEVVTKAVVKLFGRSRAHSDEFEDPPIVLLEGMSESNRAYVRAMAELVQCKLEDILVPFSRVATLDYAMDPDTVLRVMLASGHTRLPVLSNGDVVGFLHAKEFTAACLLHGHRHWHQTIRPLYRVYVNATPLDVLRDLQERKERIVLVVGGHGDLVGLVSVEDILEHAVGHERMVAEKSAIQRAGATAVDESRLGDGEHPREGTQKAHGRPTERP